MFLTDQQVIGSYFQDYVAQNIKERNDAVCKEKGMLINMDPRVAEAFHASSAVSRKCSVKMRP